MIDRVEKALAGIVGKVSAHESLARYTTYRLGGPADVYVEPSDGNDVVALGGVLSEQPMPVLVIGRGSNLVISDEGWPGVAIRLSPGFSFVEPAPGGLIAGGATALPLLANWAARRGLSGMEFTIAIPGSVGGAVRMNAGAHGSEVKDRLSSARIYDLAGGGVVERPEEGFDFSYRHSNLSDTDIVMSVAFDLEEDDPEVVRSRMESYRKHRSETQPGAVQNAGSVFRNPPGDHAGRLVEATGLKGFRIGGAKVSELHANFFIAGEGSTAQDVFDLVHEVQRRVEAQHGIRLTPEIRFVGAFRDQAGGMEPK